MGLGTKFKDDLQERLQDDEFVFYYIQDALEESELSPLASKLEHVIATISDD